MPEIDTATKENDMEVCGMTTATWNEGQCRQAMTRQELLTLPPAIDLVTAGRVLGIGRTKAHELARADEFPVRVLRLGKQYRVPTAELLELLGIDPEEAKA